MSDDLSRLQGTWQITSLEMNGAPMPAAMLANAKIVVAGDHFTSLGMGAEYTGKITIDTAATPKIFAVKFDGGGPESGRTNSAIYELDGDKWRLCIHVGGGPAPTDFTTKPGDGRAYETLVRER